MCWRTATELAIKFTRWRYDAQVLGRRFGVSAVDLDGDDRGEEDHPQNDGDDMISR